MSDDLDFMPAGSAKGSDEDAETGSDSGGSSTSKSKSEDAAPSERAELPTWNRARRKRKANVEAEKQDDAFQRGVRSASRGVIDYPKLVIGSLVIVVAVIAGGVWLHNRNVASSAEAARTLQSASSAMVRGVVMSAEEQERAAETLARYRVPVFETEEARQAKIDEALAAALDSGRGGVALDATLVSGGHAMAQGEFESALAHYEGFLSEADADHPLRFLAQEGKGLAQEALGQYEAALATFEEIAPRTSDYYRPMALYHQGRVLEALERPEEAMAIYTQYFEEFPPSREEMATPMVRDRVQKLDPEFAARMPAPPPSPFGMP